MLRNKHTEILIKKYIAIEDEELLMQPFSKIVINKVPQYGKII